MPLFDILIATYFGALTQDSSVGSALDWYSVHGKDRGSNLAVSNKKMEIGCETWIVMFHK